MLRIKKSVQAAVLGASLAVSGMALAATIQIDFDHRADFTQYKSYSWGDIKMQNSADADLIRKTIDQNLKSKGWQLIPSGGRTILFVTGDVTSEKQLETMYFATGRGWGNQWSWGNWGWSSGGVDTMPAAGKAANLVVDVFDASTKTLVYRGLAQQEENNHPDKNAQQIEKDLTKIFLKFPPK